MDVQAASGTATSAPPLPPISFPGFADPVDTSATPGGPVSASASAGSAASPAPVDTTRTAAASDVAASKSSDETLKPLVAKLYNAAEANVEVSFQVAKGLDEVVTVFTDRSTGKVIVQFPAESLVALAQFFQKLAGNILDAKA